MRKRRKATPDWAYPAALLAVLMLGLTLRLYGIDWGLPSLSHPYYSYHPDEVATLTWARWLSTGQIIQQQFVYGGTFYFTFLNSFVYFGDLLADSLSGVNLAADSILFGRYVMTAIALVTILLVYQIGNKLFDRRVGVAAALLLAICPAHIMSAQCVRVDEITALFVATIFLFTVNILQGSKRDGARYYIYSGIVLGVAIATRFPLAIFGVGPIIAHVLNRRPRTSLGAALVDRRLILMCVSIPLAFSVVSPYVFFYFGSFIDGLVLALSYQTPVFPDAVGRGPSILQYMWRVLPQATGYLVFVFALIGIARACYRRKREDVVMLSMAVPYLLVLGFAGWVVIRYTLPLLPVFAVLAAYALFYLVDAYPKWRVSIYVVAGMVVCLTLIADLAYLKVAAGKDVRDIASEWIQQNVEPGASIVTVQGYIADDYFNPVITPSHRQVAFVLRPTETDSRAFFTSGKQEYLVVSEFLYKDMARLGDQHPLPAYREFYANLSNSSFTLVKGFKNSIEMFGTDFSPFFSVFDYAIVNPGIRIYRRD